MLFNVYNQLPHRLLGVAAIIAEEAQQAAQECLRLWDRRGSRKQHAIAIRLLQTGPLRSQLENVAAGAPLVSCPELAAEVLLWRFAPVVERSIEAQHAIAKQRLAHNSAPSPAAVSLSLRLDKLLN